MKTDLIETLHWRYATKAFSPKKVSDEDLHDLKEALRLAPSSFGLQPWKFVLVNDPEVRKKVREAAFGQSQVTDASHLFVLCARTDVDEHLIKKYVASVAKTRGVSVESLAQFEGMMMGSAKSMDAAGVLDWSKRQVYIALGFLLLAAADKRIDACPMEGFDKAKVDAILGLEKLHLTAAAFCPIGYRSDDDKYAQAKKVRFDEKDVFVVK